MSIRDRIDELVDRLATAGITASPEAQDVPVPGAWIAPRSARRERMCLDLTVTVDVYLVVPDSGPLAALDALQTLLDKALTVIRPDGDMDLSTPVVLPHDPTPLPSVKLPVTLE